jgi:hypothetical protein
MDKEYCWTSQPYGNAMAKNDIIDKAIKKGTVLILDTLAIDQGKKEAGLGTKIIASGAVGIAEIVAAEAATFAILSAPTFPLFVVTVSPFIIIAALPAAALFGATAFLTRAHCNKIFIRNSNAPANAPDETAPEISTTPVAPAPETAPAVTASTTVQEATPAVTTSVPATPVAPAPETPVAPDPETSPAVTTPIVPVA